MKQDILIKNAAWAVTLDDTNTVLQNADIGIRDTRILFVQQAGKPYPADFTPEKTLPGEGRIACPGFVNAHCHGPMTLMRDFANDMDLMPWLDRMRIMETSGCLTDEAIIAGVRLAQAEMLRSGVTCYAEMYAWCDLVFDVVKETGMRANIGGQYGKDRPQTHAERWPEYRTHMAVWNGAEDGRILENVSVHAIYTVAEESIKTAIEAAKELRVPLQMHIAEDAFMEQKHIQETGKSSIATLEEWGLFDVPVIAAHCVQLSDGDFDILANHQVLAVHNPTSNMKLGNGFADVPRMVERGVLVGLGTDGTASNNNLNMFEELHLASLIHKGTHRSATCLNADTLLRMATVNGAKGLGFADVGALIPGNRADMILVNCDTLHATPMHDPVSTLVYSAQAADVETVLVNGRVLMENKRLLTIDEQQAKADVREAVRRICE